MLILNICGPEASLQIEKFWAQKERNCLKKYFLSKKEFGVRNHFESKLYLSPKKFSFKNFLSSKIFLAIFGSTILFESNIFWGPNIFESKNSVVKNFPRFKIVF